MDSPDSNDTLTCLYCGATLIRPKGAAYASGISIMCPLCTGENDYDTLIDVARAEYIQQAEEAVMGRFMDRIRGPFQRPEGRL